MPDGHVLEFTGVTKRFGPVTAVDDFSARVEPGVVTGFLGPNGAGKTTSLRILLGLIAATEGTATIGGKRYAQLRHPLQTVGAALEASSFHPGRSAANHLTVYAHAAGLPTSRVDEALGTVGLADVAGRKVGGFSLGMRQRLGLAYTLLGDPGVLVLDEPSNGLDPEGIRWMRGFLRELARQGRTVLVSSHLLAEIQQTAESLLIIARGRLVFQGTISDLTAQDEHATVVDAPDRAALAAALTDAGLAFDQLRTGLTVRGADTTRIGALAAAAGIALSNLQRRGPALEEIFLDLVNGVRVAIPAAAGAAGHAGDEDATDAEAIEGTDAEGADAPVIEATDAAGPTDPEPVAEETPAVEDPDPEDADTEDAALEEDPKAVEEESGDAAVEEESGDVADTDDAPPAVATWDAGHPTTDADLEADRFFARYDAPDADDPAESESEPAESESESDSESESETDPGSASEAESEPDADPDPHVEPESDTDSPDGGDQR